MAFNTPLAIWIFFHLITYVFRILGEFFLLDLRPTKPTETLHVVLGYTNKLDFIELFSNGACPIPERTSFRQYFVCL